MTDKAAASCLLLASIVAAFVLVGIIAGWLWAGLGLAVFVAIAALEDLR